MACGKIQPIADGSAGKNRQQKPGPAAESSSCAGLSRQDKALWQRVARSVRPLRPEPPAAAATRPAQAAKAPAAAGGSAPAESRPRQPSAAPAARATATAAAPGLFDRGLYRRLARGRLTLEARLDLHDHSQEQAHAALLSFVAQAHRRGLHYALIITGKGRAGARGGILQKQVPHWLATAPFRPYIAAVEPAARRHGGSGALYVHLRRVKSRRPP